MTGRVWYAAYGSNMSAARFRFYVEGGRPPAAERTYPGMRDRTWPLRDVPMSMPGGVYFALDSAVWGGGMAFYDPHLAGGTPARAWLLTVGQFSDLAAQEMHREPLADLDVADAVGSGAHSVGPGRYETLVRAGALDGLPVLTLTAPWTLAETTPTAPSGAYLRLLATGLAEAHGWDRERIATHLAGLPGARGVWTADAVAAELAGLVPA